MRPPAAGILVLGLITALGAAHPRHASATTQATTPAPETDSHELDVPGNQPWTDTSIDLQVGQQVTISATGSLRYMDGQDAPPDGLPRGWRDLLRAMPVNDSGRGALVGRIGSDDAAQPFLVGAKKVFTARASGRLFLGINEPSGDTADGSFHATIGVAPPKPGASGGNTASPSVTATTSSALPPSLLAKIPRRVSDKDGNPGDMVNFLIVGSEDQMKAAFAAAGWVQVDKDTKDAVVTGLLESLQKQSYVTMPMSQLFLFGRAQDFGFAHADPIKVATTRHHLRIWMSDLTVDGQPLWVGAATHDMGLEKDQRNGKLTHHIDPNVDDERDFVTRSLTESGYVGQHSNVTPSDPIKDARTATGGSFHSNGEIAVFWLNH